MRSILTVMLTDACNCDCTYCYQKATNKERMGSINLDYLKTIDKILPKIDVIQFFGGEPLLAEEFIFKLDQHIKQLILNNYLNSRPEYIFSSNLVRLSEKFKRFLFELKSEDALFTFTITVDGVQNIHDKHRKLKSGEGTYQSILDNYKFLIDNDMNCVDTIFIVYNYSHFINGITLKDCVLNINNYFPTIKYVNFNREDICDDTRIAESTFFELKYNLLSLIFEDIILKKEEYINCRPFLLAELADICGSINADNADINKCIMSGKKIAIIPNGDLYMCVDQYYSQNRPILNLKDSNTLEVEYQNFTLENNFKSNECYNCKVKTLCRICPLQKYSREICKKNMEYYDMMISYLVKIYSSRVLIKNFIHYSNMTNGMALLIYRYLNSITCI